MTDPLVAALRTAISESRTARVELSVLRAAAFGRDSSVGRDRLAAALSALAADGVVVLPSKAHWDRTRLPPLPRWVKRPPRPRAPVVVEVAAWTALPAAVQDRLGRLRPDEVALLTAVDRWLASGGSSRPMVPSRERSLQVFGDEKRLDRLTGSRLYALGIDHDLLQAEPVPVPFVSTWVPGEAGGEPLCVVAENHHTWVSLVRTARSSADRHPGIHVGYGAGSQFQSGIAAVPLLDPPVAGVSYFGDLDPRGLEIPALAGPTVRPAYGLYHLLFRHGHREETGRTIAPAVAADRAAWLGAELAIPVAKLLVDGVRLAQEAVGTDVLRGTAPRDWVC